MGFVIIQPPGDGEPNDGPQAAYVRTIADTYNVADSVALQVARTTAVAESLTAASSLQNVLTIVVEDTAALEAGDSVQLTARYLADLLDYTDVFSLIKTTSDIAQGWVMNTEGAQPISEYDNFEFNALTSFKKEFYGTADGGLYRMGGDVDVNAPITAELSSLMLDLGSSRQKRIRSAYLGYTASDELVLKVRAVSDGQLSEHWYKAREVASAEAPRAGYVRVGQGLRSRYWQFELTNVNGGDFEIDHLEMHPLFLGRRV
jgi:hypothetical protein